MSAITIAVVVFFSVAVIIAVAASVWLYASNRRIYHQDAPSRLEAGYCPPASSDNKMGRAVARL